MDDQETGRDGGEIAPHSRSNHPLLAIATIISTGLVVVPSVIYVATHNMHPTFQPGGPGDGMQNLVDAIAFGIFVVPAFLVLLVCVVSWAFVFLFGSKPSQKN